MLLSSSSCKVMNVPRNSSIDVRKGVGFLVRILQPGAAQTLLQRSRDALSDRMFEQLLVIGRRVNEYTSALEVLDHFEVELALEEFRGEI